MKIAILDIFNQDIGLNILFPDADYYIYEKQSHINDIIYNHYNICIKSDLSKLTSSEYDILLLIGTDFNTQIENMLVNIINLNHFKKIFYFDNKDYDLQEPNFLYNNNKINYIFKRNKNKNKIYNYNVVSFPFTMFGEYPIIHKLTQSRLYLYHSTERIDRIFFIGSLFIHDDKKNNIYRNRMKMFYDINSIVYSPQYLVDYNSFMNIIHDSKFSLDLNGVGDPNKRTFEILSQGSLRIGEYNDLEWPFEETFCEETIFKTKEEFFEKIHKLRNNEELYNHCLEKQNQIYLKYFNIEWLRQYILNYLK